MRYFVRPVVFAVSVLLLPFANTSANAQLQPANRTTITAEPLSACGDQCDKAASECVDACEEKHPNDAPKRVACKLDCVDKQKECVSKCK